MKPTDVIALIGDSLAAKAKRERTRLDEIDKWLSTSNPVEIARRVNQRPSSERDTLGKLAYTPILRLVTNETAQQMLLEGLSSERDDTRALWDPWERNGMPSRQGALWRASIGYGYGYTITLPGFVPGETTARAAIRPTSPRDLFAVYADEAADEWPMYALWTIPQGGGDVMYRFIDEEAVHFVSFEGGRYTYLEPQEHGAGVTPVIRYANEMDLEGRTPGEVEKHLVPAERLNKTTFDRLLIQHFNSWRVRTATGLEEPGSTEEQERIKTLLRNEDILTGGEGVTFGSLPETTLDGVLKAADDDRDTVAAMSQTPVWALNGGQLVNLSADAIAEARSASRLKVQDKQRSMGRPLAQNFRLAAHIEGRTEDAADFSLKAKWADLESRSMSQSADALGKIATQLQVPVEKLWDLIPGISKATADEWREWREEHPTDAQALAGALDRQTGL